MRNARTRVASLALCALTLLPPLTPTAGAQDATGAVAATQASPAATPASPTLAELLPQARNWIDRGEAERAWQALDARVGDYGGDPEFDYLLGLAALDSGRPGRAVFALERVLMVKPDFLQARAELARAYFALREHENARREFETVAASEIPREARQVIGRYLDAIRFRERRDEPRFTASAQFEGGYDSNVNFGSASGRWVLADGTAVLPLGLSRPRESAAIGAALTTFYHLHLRPFIHHQ